MLDVQAGQLYNQLHLLLNGSINPPWLGGTFDPAGQLQNYFGEFQFDTCFPSCDFKKYKILLA